MVNATLRPLIHIYNDDYTSIPRGSKGRLLDTIVLDVIPNDLLAAWYDPTRQDATVDKLLAIIVACYSSALGVPDCDPADWTIATTSSWRPSRWELAIENNAAGVHLLAMMDVVSMFGWDGG